MIRRLALAQVSDPVLVVADGQLQASGERTTFVVHVEQSFDDPEEAEAVISRIQRRVSILEAQIEYCSGSGRWPEGVSGDRRSGVCPICRVANTLEPNGASPAPRA